MAYYSTLPKHHLINFFTNLTVDGIRVTAACACGARLTCTGADRSRASSELEQIFVQHKVAPCQESLGIQPPQQESAGPAEKKEEARARIKRVPKEVREYYRLDLPLPHALAERPPSAAQRLLATLGKWEDVTYEQLAELALQIQRCQLTLGYAAKVLGVRPQKLTKALRRARLSTAKISDLEDLFWYSITMCTESACWVWNGPLASGAPYLRFDGRTINIRHYAWSLAYGPLGKRRCVRVICCNPLCVNPDHLLVSREQSRLLEAA
ncbi:MAG: hypothetical protein ACOYYS_22575 [Chloroflexota bacterium]